VRGEINSCATSRILPVSAPFLCTNDSDHFEVMFLSKSEEKEENQATIEDIDPYIMHS